MVIQIIKDDFKWIAKLYDTDLSCKRDLICIGYAEGETEEDAINTLKENYSKEKEIRSSMKIIEWTGESFGLPSEV